MAEMSVELYRQIREDALPTEVVLEGRTYTIRNVSPVKDPVPAPFEVNTLTGLVDYLKTNVDKLNIEELICHVESPGEVSVFTALHGPFRQRSEFIRAKLDIEAFPFGDFISAERFNIGLQACFAETPVTVDGEIRATDKGLILKMVGNVKESMVKEVGDDGVSQSMAIKSGIAMVENIVLPNPVILRPYRTFNEVEQPASGFVFRAQDGPRFALFEADNGVWKSEAMKSIKAFLQFEVSGLHVIA